MSDVGEVLRNLQKRRVSGRVRRSLVEKGVIDPVKLTPHRDRYRQCGCPTKYPAGSPAFGYDYCRGCGFLIGIEGTNR